MALNRCVLVFLLTALIIASEPGDRAGIDGFVTSDIIATIPGATVGIDSPTGAFHRRTATNSSGYYVMDDVEPGGYSIWAEAKPYGCIIYPRVALFPGERAHQDFHFARAKRYPRSCEPVEKKTK